MSDSKNQPMGDALAVIGDDDGDSKALFVQLGPVWRTKSGHLRFEMQSEPVAWSDPRCRRVVLIKKREQR